MRYEKKDVQLVKTKYKRSVMKTASSICENTFEQTRGQNIAKFADSKTPLQKISLLDGPML